MRRQRVVACHVKFVLGIERVLWPSLLTPCLASPNRCVVVSAPFNVFLFAKPTPFAVRQFHLFPVVAREQLLSIFIEVYRTPKTEPFLCCPPCE